MKGISLLVLVLLVQSSQCSLRQDSTLSDFKECSNEQSVAFLKEQKRYYGPRLVIKEKLISPLESDTLSGSLSMIEKDQFVEYQRKSP